MAPDFKISRGGVPLGHIETKGTDLAEIERGRGKEYDGDAADACLRLFREGRYQLPA